MENTLLEIAKDNLGLYVFVIVSMLISIAIKSATGFISFYEDTFVKRYFKRLTNLTENLNPDSKVTTYLNTLKENEAFRMTSGVNTYPDKSKILIDIYLTGIIANTDFKRISPFLEPSDDLIEICVSQFEKFSFAYSFFSLLLLVGISIITVISSLVQTSGIQLVAGLIASLLFFFLGLLLGKDYRTLVTLRRVQKRLVDKKMISNPDKRIEWGSRLEIPNFKKVLKPNYFE